MNNKFSFNRFGKVLALDGKKYLRNFGVTFAILCSLNVGTWLISTIFGFVMPAMARWAVIYIAVFLASILVPAKAFGDINLQREGVRFAMLPASNIEKYTSYVLYCILTPFAVALVSYGIDSLLTLLPFGGFHSFIRHFGMMGSAADFLNDVYVDDPGAVGDIAGLNAMVTKLGSVESWNHIIGILFTIGFFMFGNLLFKTHKTGKSFGVMMGFSYVLSLIMQTIMLTSDVRNFFFPEPDNIDMNAIGDLVGGTMTISIIVYALLTIGLYVGLFFKLKTQKY